MTTLSTKRSPAQVAIDYAATEPHFWPLDSNITFLNHGSFGSCPRVVLEFQRQLRDRLERQPVQFLVREFEGLLDEARGFCQRPI
jgi:isopenicillin-N epimerase